jgi:Transposase DDE domain
MELAQHHLPKGPPMKLTVAHLADTLQTLLTATADHVARQTGFVRRQRQLTGASFTQALVFGWLDNPQATLEDLAQAALTVGTPISPQGLDQRFTPQAADCLRALLQHALGHVFAGQAQALPLLQRFNGVYLLDGTTLSLPACLAELWPGCGGSTPQAGKAALKVQVRWELLRGTLDGLTLHAGRESETHSALAQGPLPQGALRLADLGYFHLETLGRYSDQGVYWLSRLQANTAVLVDGRPVKDLARWLARQGSDTVDVAVALGSRCRLPCRLLAVRVAKAVRRRRQRRLWHKARLKCRRPQARQLALCAWEVYVTNVPPAKASLSETLVLGRCRWQVELLFKLWKSQGQIDASASSKPYRVLCEVYGKLLAMVVQHWVTLLSWSESAGRSVRKAARVVRRHALHLACVLRVAKQLRQVLMLLQRCLRHGLKINKRRREPALFQLLLEPPQVPRKVPHKPPPVAA